MAEPSLRAAVKKSRLDGLRALRATLAEEIVSGSGAAVAVLARQLRETLREIAELEKDLPKGSAVDDLARRRKTRSPSPARVRAGRGTGS